MFSRRKQNKRRDVANFRDTKFTSLTLQSRSRHEKVNGYTRAEHCDAFIPGQTATENIS